MGSEPNGLGCLEPRRCIGQWCIGHPRIGFGFGPLTLCWLNETAPIHGRKHCAPKHPIKLEKQFNMRLAGICHGQWRREDKGPMSGSHDGNVNAHVAVNVVGLAEKHLC